MLEPSLRKSSARILGSLKLSTSGGCFKRELALLASPLIEIALRTRVPAGHALAVDRRLFAAEVTRKIESEKNIELVREEIKDIDSRPDAPPTLIATGPLTSDPLLRTLSLLLGEDSLYFSMPSARRLKMTRSISRKCFSARDTKTRAPIT